MFKRTTLLIFLMLFLLVGCSNNQVGSSNYSYNYEGYSEYTYTFNEKSFSFKYPENWIVEEQPAWEASEGVEASPDWGVRIYVEGDEGNSVYIFGSFSSPSITEESSYEKKEFEIENTKKGDIFTQYIDGRMDMYVLYEKKEAEGFHNAIVNVTEDFYKNHKDEIWHILGSVTY